MALHWVCSAPDMKVWCDRVRTEQIVWNLLDNAIKFTPAGGSMAVTLSQDGDFAQLCVTDTGVGIAPEHLQEVFGLFAQGGVPSAHGSGLGIGLALVKELSTAQGGDVVVASKGLGQGATFTVRLPLAGHSENVAKARLDSQPLRGLRLLLVDDMEDALMLFAVVLEHEGAEVDTATSGPAALELLGRNRYDLLISDIGMPGMDGYALLAALRKLPGQEQLRTIAVTGYGRAADAERALSEGFDAHTTKPVDFEDLKKSIGALCRLPRTAAMAGSGEGAGAHAGPQPDKGSGTPDGPDSPDRPSGIGPAGPAA